MAIVRWFRQLQAAGEPIWWYKVHGGPSQTRGVPDLYVILRGRSVHLEVKRPGGRPSPLQDHVIGQINKAGGHACVVWSVEDAKREMLRDE